MSNAQSNNDVRLDKAQPLVHVMGDETQKQSGGFARQARRQGRDWQGKSTNNGTGASGCNGSVGKDEVKTCGIYGIFNLIDGRCYIGQSVAIEKRKWHHLYDLKRGKHYNHYLQRAFTKYGEQAFEFRILECEIAEDVLNDRERFWIDHYKSDQTNHGFNLEDGGSARKHLSEETKRKISKAQTGKVRSEETRRKIAENNRCRTEETRRKMSESLKGRVFSDETKHKMSESRRKQPLTADNLLHLLALSQRNIGRKHSADAKLKMRASWIGRKGIPRSEETRRRISESNRGKHFKLLSMSTPKITTGSDGLKAVVSDPRRF